MEDFPRKYGMVGASDKIIELYENIERVAPKDTKVLIRGERGTGKELVSKAIHENSQRKDKPHVIINCAAFQPTLLESEMFGHERGAFTDAYKQKIGKFQYADGGTIFLDEIADICLDIQPKLLRALEYGEFQRVGGNETLKADIRLIAATSKDIEKLISEDKFRSELYDRINVFPLFVPPLRERGNDIYLLIKYFIDKHKGNGISPEAIDKLKSYKWPGNVRQLESTIERLVIDSKGEEITLNLVEQCGLDSRKDHYSLSAATNEDISDVVLEYPEGSKQFEKTLGSVKKLENGLESIKNYLETHEADMARLEKVFTYIGSIKAYLSGHHENANIKEKSFMKRLESVENDMMAIRESLKNISSPLERPQKRGKYVKGVHEKTESYKPQEKGEPKYLRLKLREFSELTEIPLSTLYAPIRRGSIKSESKKDGTLVKSSDFLDYFKGSGNEYAVNAIKRYAKKNPGLEIYIQKK